MEAQREIEMDAKRRLTKALLAVLLVLGYLCGGCHLVGIMGTGGSSEKKIPAEYALGQQKGRKLLVLVSQPAWLATQASVRYHLTEAISDKLVEDVKLSPADLIGYEAVTEFRSKREDFAMLTPAEVGKALGAELVLAVTIDNLEFGEMADTGYYRAYCRTKSALYEAAGDKRLWPAEGDSREVAAGFDVDLTGPEGTMVRLTNSLAQGITRYFYNCPVGKFRIPEERLTNIYDWK